MTCYLAVFIGWCRGGRDCQDPKNPFVWDGNGNLNYL